MSARERESSISDKDSIHSIISQQSPIVPPLIKQRVKGKLKPLKLKPAQTQNGQGEVLHHSVGPSKAFLLQVTGRIESADIYGANDIYCKYNLSMGGDWVVTAGMEEGISQVTSKDQNNIFVWNFPLEVTFKSSNPYGWPQLILSVYGADMLGNHIAKGYGTTHFPVSKGIFTKMVPLFVPESSSFVQKISSWLMGRQPEFVDPKVLSKNEGRQVVRVESCGHVVVKFEVVTKDLAQLGYTTSEKVYNHNV